MERLTEKITNKETGKILAYRPLPGVGNVTVYRKLGKYEDIGLSPEQVQQLSETGIVEYSYGQYELKVKTTDGKEAYSNLINKLSEAPFEIEKLGNIFDNPDLLEVE